MRDELDCRVWNAHHDSAGDTLTRITEDCAKGIETARQALLHKVRDAGFRSAIMVAALMVSGTSILLTVTPVGAA
ncbi:hypothetical protein HFP51_01275 [Parasphingopyxis sp. CP4]|uniref:hypothetical protein n=1 Tax=Parasphingopyxis sp. CP4 TaxID=2724527 RepID=UPI0015A14ABE|nr:hypothetical protein [Parasphingopyxis sp. CP4]QLC20935.1 hypothetical protein HFP51_01275 [Parasphingopyxis sp. CP4]